LISNLALIDFPNLSISLLQKPTTELIQGEGVSIFHRQDRGKPVEQKSLPSNKNDPTTIIH